MNIMNITGIVSNGGGSTNLAPSRPTHSDKSQLLLSQKLVNQPQQTKPGNPLDRSIQTLASLTADLSVQTKSNDEQPVAVSSKVAAAVALQAEVDQLKKEVANNRTSNASCV